jgi:hypothetical protein
MRQRVKSHYLGGREGREEKREERGTGERGHRKGFKKNNKTTLSLSGHQ